MVCNLVNLKTIVSVRKREEAPAKWKQREQLQCTLQNRLREGRRMQNFADADFLQELSLCSWGAECGAIESGLTGCRIGNQGRRQRTDEPPASGRFFAGERRRASRVAQDSLQVSPLFCLALLLRHWITDRLSAPTSYSSESASRSNLLTSLRQRANKPPDKAGFLRRNITTSRKQKPSVHKFSMKEVKRKDPRKQNSESQLLKSSRVGHVSSLVMFNGTLSRPLIRAVNLSVY